MNMELDTGASLTIISEKTYRDTWPQNPPLLQPSTTKLCMYTREELEVRGCFNAKVPHKGQMVTLEPDASGYRI